MDLKKVSSIIMLILLVCIASRVSAESVASGFEASKVWSRWVESPGISVEVLDNNLIRKTYSDPVYVWEDKKWKNWTQAKSLKGSSWSCVVTKNVSTDPDVVCVDFNSTHRILRVSDSSLKSQSSIPIKYEVVSNLSVKSFQNVTSVTLKNSSEQKEVVVPVLSRYKLHVGESSTVVTIMNSKGVNIRHGDQFDDLGNTFFISSSPSSSAIMTFDVSSIPSSALIEGVEFAGIVGGVADAPPDCTEGEIHNHIDSSGYIELAHSDVPYDHFGDGSDLNDYIQGQTRAYGTYDIAELDDRCYAPASTTWGDIDAYIGIGFNNSQWLVGNSSMVSDLQTNLSSGNFSFGIRTPNYWLESTGEPPQNNMRIRVTYSSVSYNVSSCVNITSAGSYSMNQSIINTPGNPCIDIQVDDVVLDCNGFKVDGTGILSSSTGIATTTGSTKSNVTIQNCNVSDYGTLIYGASSVRNIWGGAVNGGFGWRFDGGTAYVDNVTIIYPPSATGRAFYLQGGTFVFINNSVVNTSTGTATSSSMFGLWIGTAPDSWNVTNSYFVNIGVPFRVVGSTGNIYNNYFNTQTAIQEYSTSLRQNWNTSLKNVPNLLGGNYVGGNYWARLGSAFCSETCADSDANGICDNSCVVGSSNDIDYLPLSNSQFDTQDPTINFITPANNSVLNGNILLYANATDYFGIQNVTFYRSNGTNKMVLIADDILYPYQTLMGSSALASGLYNLTAIARDLNGNMANTTILITIDKSAPVIVEFDTVYPIGQQSANNGSVVLLRVNVTDGNLSSGINYTKVNVTKIRYNETMNLTMAFTKGSKYSGNYSYWELNNTINSTTGLKQLPFYVVDNATPSNTAYGSLFNVQVDNDNPLWTGAGTSLSDIQNNTEIDIFVTLTDNFLLKNCNFSSNITGSWVNESVVVTGTSQVASVTKTVYTGNYSYAFYFTDDAGNKNNTGLQTFSVRNTTTAGNETVLSVFLFSPADDLINSTALQNFQFYYTGGNASNCTLILNGEQNRTHMNSTQPSMYHNFTNIQLYNGTWLWSVGCIENTTQEYYESSSRTLYIDTFPPSFNIPENLTVIYGSVWSASFYSSETATYHVNDSRFSIDSGGTLTNATKLSGTKTYQVNVTVNDSVNNKNSTNFKLIVNPAPTNTTLEVNGSRANITATDVVKYVSLSGVLNVSQNISLHLNGTQLNISIGSVKNISNVSIGLFLFMAKFVGNENYSSSNESWNVSVTISESDILPPTIENLTNYSTTATSSHILWNCDESCNYTINVWNATDILNQNSSGYSLNFDLTFSGLANGTTYFVNLTVWDNAGNSASNNSLSFTTGQPPPAGAIEDYFRCFRIANISNSVSMFEFCTDGGIYIYAPNRSKFKCGVNNSGVFSCA